jgi:DHA1 family multidrug resistance protein-like MFS transporter
MVARACFGGGLIVGAMALARTPLELFGLRTLQGGFSGTVAATRTLLTSVVPASQLGFTLGIMQTAVFVGNSFGPLLGGFISDAAGYKVSFLATGALLAISGVIVMVFVRENFTPPVAADANARHGWRDAVAMIERTPGLSAVIVTLFLVSAAQNAMGPVLPLFVKTLVADAHTQIASMAGLVLGITAVTSALAAGFGGRIGDRYGHGRMMAVCAIIGGILYIPQALVTSPYELLAWRGLLGLFTGGLMPGTMAIVALRTPSAHRGWVFGLTTTATALGNAAGPMAGAAAATTLGLRATFVVTGLILTIAGVWAAWSTGRTVRAATPTP